MQLISVLYVQVLKEIQLCFVEDRTGIDEERSKGHWSEQTIEVSSIYKYYNNILARIS